MRSFSTKTMADLFIAAVERWTQRALEEPVPDFYQWCLIGELLGTGPEQFKPLSGDPSSATGPDFADGGSVTFADGSVAVRDLDELRHGRPADWRALPSLPEDIVRQLQNGSL
jgi:hypothetical protein